MEGELRCEPERALLYIQTLHGRTALFLTREIGYSSCCFNELQTKGDNSRTWFVYVLVNPPHLGCMEYNARVHYPYSPGGCGLTGL